MSTHTKGPWEVERVLLEESDDTVVWFLVNANGVFVCGGPAETTGSDACTRAEADARLIAASPDMLSAIEAVIDWWEDTNDGQVVPSHIQAAYAAVKKAKEIK